MIYENILNLSQGRRGLNPIHYPQNKKAFYAEKFSKKNLEKSYISFETTFVKS